MATIDEMGIPLIIAARHLRPKAAVPFIRFVRYQVCPGVFGATSVFQGGTSALPTAVDRYWHCVAAKIEAGLIDEQGSRLLPTDADRDLEAYRDWRRRHPSYRVPG